MRCKNIFILVFAVLLLGAVSASFSYYENGSSITTNYEVSDYLRAKINISFFNESLDSVITDTLGNSMTLETLLEKSPEYSYLFYDITNQTIISAYQILDIGKANFSMPSEVKNFTYILSIGGVNIFGKSFSVMSNKNLVQQDLNEKYSQLNRTKSEIGQYDIPTQQMLSDTLNLTVIENSLNVLQAEYVNANTEAEYVGILENISNITIPLYISESISTNQISFYPNRDEINLDTVRNIGGGDYGTNSQGYTDAIYAWNEANLKTNVAFREIVANYESGEQVTLRIFDFEFDKSKMTNQTYFIVKNMENLKFVESYSKMEEPATGYTFIKLNDIANSIVFSTTDDVNFLNVPAFISPSLNDLAPVSVGPFPLFTDNGKSKWVLFVIIIVIVVLIAVISYVMLQIWYRRKYENYLFKNRNNLFNIMTFIQTAKKKDMSREDILRDLKKAGWTREQINYAIKKYEGKKILGIIGGPFNKFSPETEDKPAETQKRLQEISKNPSDAGITKV